MGQGNDVQKRRLDRLRPLPGQSSVAIDSTPFDQPHHAIPGKLANCGAIVMGKLRARKNGMCMENALKEGSVRCRFRCKNLSGDPDAHAKKTAATFSCPF